MTSSVSRCSRAARAPLSMNPSVVLVGRGACPGWPRAGAAGWPSGRSRCRAGRGCAAKPVAWSPFIGLTPGVTSRSYSGSLISKSDVDRSSPTLSTSAWNPAEPVVTTYCGWTPVSWSTSSAISCRTTTGKTGVDLRRLVAVELDHGVPRNPDGSRLRRSRSSSAISSMASALPSASPRPGPARPRRRRPRSPPPGRLLDLHQAEQGRRGLRVRHEQQQRARPPAPRRRGEASS